MPPTNTLIDRYEFTLDKQIYDQVKAVRPSGSPYDPGLGLAPQEWSVVYPGWTRTER